MAGRLARALDLSKELLVIGNADAFGLRIAPQRHADHAVVASSDDGFSGHSQRTDFRVRVSLTAPAIGVSLGKRPYASDRVGGQRDVAADKQR